MDIKGLDKLAAHVPELNFQGGRFKLVGTFLGIFALTTIYFVLTDQIPTWTLDSQVVVMALGYLILSRFFTQRKKLLAQYGNTAYHHAFWRYVLPGLAIIFAAVAHIAYMNGPRFTQPSIVIAFTWLGWLCIIIGAALWVRAVQTFGADNATMLYVYFPQEGRMVNSSIYEIIRHPVYAGVLRLCIGFALLNMGIYAIVFILILPLGLFGWLRLVEEKELLTRFQGYAEYRRQTPAFWPRIQKIPAFFKFLVTGK